LSTATFRYERRGRVDNRELLARLQAHAAERPRFGYRRLHTLVAREGLVANHKRVHKVLRGAGLEQMQDHLRVLGVVLIPGIEERIQGDHGGGGRPGVQEGALC
jgi:putative transposase